MMKDAYGYSRVSHLDGLEPENSLRILEDSIKQRLERLQMEEPSIAWGGMFVDSFTSDYRKQFNQRPQGAILDRVLERGDIVIFARMDRSFCYGGDFFQMLDLWNLRGIRVVFCDRDLDTSTEAGKAFIDFLAILEHLQSAIISDRTKEGQAYKRLIGGLVGEVPIGKRSVRSNTLRMNLVIEDHHQLEILDFLENLRSNNPRLGRDRLSDELEDWLAQRENRKSFRGIRSRYRYTPRRVANLLSLARKSPLVELQ